MACGFKKLKRSTNYCALHYRIVRLAARITQREVREDKTRNPALLDNILRRAKHHSGEAISFKMPSDQTHGLVANRSQRY